VAGPRPDCNSDPDWALLQSHVLSVLPNAELDTIAITACRSGDPDTMSRIAAYPEPGVIGYSRSVRGRVINAVWIPSAAGYVVAVERE
jgi:hypothetical protein